MRHAAPVVALLTLAVTPLPARAGLWDLIRGFRDLEVITVTDINGFRQAANPDQPQYYVAASLGFRDLGPAIAGFSEPPPDKAVVHLLSAELAKQGYLPATPQSPPPTLLLVYTWGTLNAERFSGPDPSYVRQLNHGQLLRFLGGEKVGMRRGFFDSETAPAPGLTPQSYLGQRISDVAREDLFVFAVAAYDYSDAIELKRQPPVWTTRISAPSLGFSFSNVFPAMLAIGGQQFGRHTPSPVWVNASEKFKPDVRLGELQLLEYLNGEPLPVNDASELPLEKQ